MRANESVQKSLSIWIFKTMAISEDDSKSMGRSGVQVIERDRKQTGFAYHVAMTNGSRWSHSSLILFRPELLIP